MDGAVDRCQQVGAVATISKMEQVEPVGNSEQLKGESMENTTIKDVILDKKMDRYGFKDENFLASGELTVTITLGEYRHLVEDVATAKNRIDKAESDRYERNKENEALKEENNRLKAELYELKKAMDTSEENEETEWKSE